MKQKYLRMIGMVILAIFLSNFIHSTPLLGEIISVTDLIFYHPSDSTIYFVVDGIRWWDDDSPFSYLFRLKDEAHRIARSSDFKQMMISPDYLITHNNIGNRIYGSRFVLMEGNQWLVSEDAGDNWEELNIPYYGINSPGGNPGESFLTGYLHNGERYRSILYSTTDSWNSWDTSYVVENWNSHDNVILFTRQNGHLIRFLRDERDYLDFSSDTGRTWVAGDLDGELIPLAATRHTWAGVGDEFYCGHWGLVFWCISDSGRIIREVFDFRDHGPYDYVDEGGFQWNEGYLVTTPNPGEFYAIIDSTSWDSWGIKMDIYHVWDYGEEIQMLRYYMPKFEPCDPEWVVPDISPLPSTSLFSVFPNPFNSSTTITYQLPHPAHVSLVIYDLCGRMVDALVDERQDCGIYNTIWQPDNLASGLYFVRLEVPGQALYSILMLIK